MCSGRDLITTCLYFSHVCICVRNLDGEWINLVDPEDSIATAEWGPDTEKVVEWFQKKIPGSYTETSVASITWAWDESHIEIGQQYVSC